MYLLEKIGVGVMTLTSLGRSQARLAVSSLGVHFLIWLHSLLCFLGATQCTYPVPSLPFKTKLRKGFYENCLLLLLFRCGVVSDSWRPHGLKPTRPLCPWDSPGKNPGVGCHALLQGIFQPRDWAATTRCITSFWSISLLIGDKVKEVKTLAMG